VHVLSVSSLKGGVGKTTVALGLASAAFSQGLRTLVVDLDPQCDATTGLGAIGEFAETVADVIQNPRHSIVHRAIVSSTWNKLHSGTIDVMVGSPKTQTLDTPSPTINEIWRLEVALAKLESSYDLVIIDTPPSVNGLTRTAWVASDRVIIVSEPSLFSVVAADRTMHALAELRRGLTNRLETLGILINRFRPQSTEGDFRVSELREKYGNRILPEVVEERTVLQQAQGAGRPIHGWPGESAIEIAGVFDRVLEYVQNSFGQQTTIRPSRASRKVLRLNRVMRGQTLDEVLKLEANEPADDLSEILGIAEEVKKD
jgi:cellulose biosynthesis protein BcsQ